MKSIDVNVFNKAESDSEMIQLAVDMANEKGTTVVIPIFNSRTSSYTYIIDKPIILKSNSKIILANCHLRQETGCFCNIFKNQSADITENVLEYTDSNISIIGYGNALLDGGIYNGLSEKTALKNGLPDMSKNHLIFFRNANNIIISDINIQNQRYWAICFRYCSNCKINNISFESSGNVPNQDGIDLRAGCHDFSITNIRGCTGDDVIALTALTDSRFDIPNVCKDIYNVKIKNVYAYGVCGNAMIRLLNHDGIKIHDISIKNVVEISPYSAEDYPVAVNPDSDENVGENGLFKVKKPIKKGEHGYRLSACIRIGENFWYRKEKAKLGDTYNISVKKVKTHARIAVCINAGLCNAKFTNFNLFGNAYMSAYFGMGEYKDIVFKNFKYDSTTFKMDGDAKIDIDWNATHTEGYNAINFYMAKVENICFEKFTLPMFIEKFSNDNYEGDYKLLKEKRC